MNGQVLHHLMVRTNFIEESDHSILDKLIAVGNADHNHVELFKLSTLKWERKKEYMYVYNETSKFSQKETESMTERITKYSILAVEEKFVLFGGMGWKWFV